MNFESGKLRIPLWLILAGAVTIATAGLSYLYYKVDDNSVKTLGLVGGVVSGLIVYLATFLTLLRPIQELDRFHRMGIKALLTNRHDQNYYRRLVARSRQRVDVMGASCSRFVQDFLDLESEDKVLVDALTKHNQLRVRLLIPEDPFMGEDARNRARKMLRQLEVLRGRFGNRVELRRFTHAARHSFVLVDNDMVAGPIFEDDRSRYAPAVHVAAETPFSQKYCDHFDAVWDKSRDYA